MPARVQGEGAVEERNEQGQRIQLFALCLSNWMAEHFCVQVFQLGGRVDGERLEYLDGLIPRGRVLDEVSVAGLQALQEVLPILVLPLVIPVTKL